MERHSATQKKRRTKTPNLRQHRERWGTRKRSNRLIRASRPLIALGCAASLTRSNIDCLTYPVDDGRCANRSPIKMNDSYTEDFKRMRRLRWWLLFAMLIGPIGATINHLFIDPTNRTTPGLVAFYVVWISFTAGISFQFQHMRCPRCGRPWKGDWLSLSRVGFWNALRVPRQCANCGLEMTK